MTRAHFHSPKTSSFAIDRGTELRCILDGIQSSPNNIIFSTCSLIAFALTAITLCSCRMPLRSDLPNAPAENRVAKPTRCPMENNGLAKSGVAGAAGYGSLPPSAYTGAMPAPAMSSKGDSPIFVDTKIGTVPVPLPVAAYPPWAPPGIRQPWPEDEYLRDGGDAGVPVGIPGQSGVAGLQMEDTVAVYDALDGRTLTTPSNEVYIYSPRFAAVRQVVGLVANEQKERISDVYLNASLSTPTVTQKIGTAKQQVQAGNEISARPAQAFRMKQGDGALSSVIGPLGFQNAFKVYENISVIRQGVFENAEKPLLARSHQAAVTWSHVQAVQVILDRQGAMAAVQDEQVETVYTAAVPPGNPKLRIIKLASTPDALPGEEVWFTIRFDNVGNQTIGNVTIIDSLSTRLQYVEGSAQCSREAAFYTQPNEGDSLVVRCELAKPLEVGKGGLIRFCCKVR